MHIYSKEKLKNFFKYKIIVKSYNNINLYLCIHVYLYFFHNILLNNNHLLHIHLISILYFLHKLKGIITIAVSI